MCKNILYISVIAVALSAGGAAYAKGPGSAGEGQGYGTHTGQGMSTQDAQPRGETKRAEKRGDEPLKQQDKAMEQERVKDGSGTQHENRTLTQEQKDVNTRNEAQIRQQTETQVKPMAPGDEPKQLQEQIQEESQQQLRIKP